MSDQKFISIPKTIEPVPGLKFPFLDWLNFLVDTDDQFNKNMSLAIVGSQIKAKAKDAKSSVLALKSDEWKPLRDAAFAPSKGHPVLTLADHKTGEVKGRVELNAQQLIPYFQAIDLASNTDPRGSRHAGGGAASPRKLIRKAR